MRLSLLAGQPHFLADLALAIGGGAWEGAETVGQNVAGTQPRQDLGPAWRRVVQVRHHRQAQFPGAFKRDIEGVMAAGPAGAETDPDLDADHQIPVLPRNANAFARVQEPEISTFAHHHGGREGEDAGKRYVEKGQYPNLRPLDHMGPEAGHVGGRFVEVAQNVEVKIGDISVRPDDWVVADGSGVVFIPQEKLDDVEAAVKEILLAESNIRQSIAQHQPLANVFDQKYETLTTATDA